MQRFLKYLKSNLYLDVWVVLFFLLSFGIEPILGIKDGFVFDPIRQVFKGYVTIICSSSILITDYVYIAGLGATFFNVATILMLNLLLIKKNEDPHERAGLCRGGHDLRVFVFR